MRGPAFAQGGQNPMEGMGAGVLMCVMCCLCIFLTIVIACKLDPAAALKKLSRSGALVPCGR